MARVSWFDEKTKLPLIEEEARKLDSFAQALADGVVDQRELQAQQEALVATMKEVESELNDELHAKVTRLLVEVTNYSIMRLLHELQVGRMRQTFR